MKHLLSNKNFYFMILIDVLLVLSAYVLAYFLRFDAQIPPDQWQNIQQTMLYVALIKVACFSAFRLYRGMWRFASLVDLKDVFLSVAFSSLLVVLWIAFVYRFHNYSRSVFFIDGLLTLLFIGGVRIGVRIVLNRGFSPQGFFLRHASSFKKILILGAGAAGEKVIREILDNPGLELSPMGMLDDDRRKWGQSIHGVRVLGAIENMAYWSNDFDEILIAIPSATSEAMRRIVTLCEASGKRFRTMPSLGELIDGSVSMKAVRDVRIEDLMGREEVVLEKELLYKIYKNKRILVTGAGGSIGSELVRQICRFAPQAVGLVDFCEYNLFQVERLCEAQFRGMKIRTYMTDIRDLPAVEQTFRDFRPEVVFHAAAYKHVPLQETHPRETVYNNVLGTKNVADVSQRQGVERFVLVSTDKAVRPTNVMGAAKRVAEMYLEGINGSSPSRFMAVRFGNVLGSSGSVVPIFQQQIMQRQPLTVTHPDVTRYFMSIPEAAQLILQAGAMGEGGEVFILDMGKPVRIADMARDLIRLHGLDPDKDIPIHYIGLRPGEKLYEELITEGEGIVGTSHEKIRVIRGRSHHLETLNGLIDELIGIADSYDSAAIKRKLNKIVPEYSPSNDV